MATSSGQTGARVLAAHEDSENTGAEPGCKTEPKRLPQRRRRRGGSVYDAACKQLLAHKPLLAYIMQNTIEEYRYCTLEEIIELYIDDVQTSAVPVDPARVRSPLMVGQGTESPSVGEGTVAYDVLFHARLPGRQGAPVGLMVNIEAQSQHNPGYPLLKRALYYCARLISDQHGSGDAAAEYAGIEKVYSIWICTSAPAEEQDTIAEYSVREIPLAGAVSRDPAEYDLQTVIMICLPTDKNRSESSSFTEALSVLFSPNTEYDAKMQVLENQLGPALAGQFEGKAEDMGSLTDWVMDMGVREGKQKALVASIRNVMEKLAFTEEQAMEVLEIPEEYRQYYHEVLAGEREIPRGEVPRGYNGPEW